jgi:hypothetical protein
MHCWHLKDHVKNDLTLKRSLRDRLCAIAHSAPVLRHAQKIANGSKHCSFIYATAMKGAHDLEVGPLGDNPTAKTYPLVSLPKGRAIRAIDLAEKAANQWTRILVKGGLKLP